MPTSQTGTESVVASQITLENEPGILYQTVLGAGASFTESIHATGMTSVLAQVFSPQNTATQPWIVVPLDAAGNATVSVTFTESGQYLNVAATDTLTNTVTYPVTLAGTLAATVADATVTLVANSELFVTVPDTIMQTGGDNTIIASAGSLTVNATGGSDIIFDAVGNDIVNEAPVSEFVGAAGGATSTIIGAAGGTDTINAGTSVYYDGAAASNSLFIGGSGAASVVAAANEVAFGGTGGGSYTVGSTGFFFAGGGGSDTITATAGSSTGFIWGGNNENLSYASLAGAASAPGALLVASGNADTINAQNSAGGNTFFIYNQVPSGQSTFAGNTTLVGSNAGNDGFAVFVDSTQPPDHTITIDNWQSSDSMFITNLTSAGNALSAADAAAISAFEAPGGGQSFTLSDGTTFDFTGAKPSAVYHF